MFPKHLLQPEGSFRFAVDSLLLPAFFKDISCKCRILDLGTGCGVIALAYLLKQEEAKAVGVDFQPELIEAARLNAKKLALDKRADFYCLDIRTMFKKISDGQRENKASAKAEQGVKEKIGTQKAAQILPDDFSSNFSSDFSRDYCKLLSPASFDLVFANPPYGILGKGRLPADLMRQKALFAGEDSLAVFFRAAFEALKPSGRLGIIFSASRLQDLLKEAKKVRFGLKRLLIVYGREGKRARLVVLECQKDAKDDLKILPPLLLHDKANSLTAEALAFCPELACNP